MKTLERRLKLHAKANKLRQDTIEQDYILTWLLKGLVEHPKVKETFVFKGGTALKKCFFGTYRFSEDLDFTALDTAPAGDALEEVVREVCQKVEGGIQEYANISIICERYTEKQPHPSGQEAFTIKGQFPWQREHLRKVMVEITRSEELLFTPERRPLLHDYEEDISAQILCYTLEEIVLEKLRAILQQTQKLHERSWTRSRARDYYDLWRIFGVNKSLLSLKDFVPLLKKKCLPKGVDFEGAGDFMAPEMLSRVRQDWKSWLAPLIADCPPIDQVLEDLEGFLIKAFKDGRRKQKVLDLASDRQEVGPDLRVSDVAKRLRVSESFIRNLCDSGKLPFYKVGKERRIKEKDLNSYLKHRRAGTEKFLRNLVDDAQEMDLD